MERPELIKYLAGAEVKLILVAAPPGFGKTTLVAQWRCSPVDRKPFAWVCVDRGDNDPVRLWWHVVSSLHLVCPAFDSEKVLATLRGQDPDFGGTVLPVLVHEMASLPEQVVLVLDDYHLIKNATCHEQVALLLGRLPPSVRVVIATRADPPLPLARMRALGEMAEIRARELRFDVQQAAELIHAIVAAELSERDLASLVRRTEGWPAGLHLAALSMRRDPSPDAFVRQFSGANRFIVDYLVEDVLNQQPSGIREFLTRTSILGRFCAPLCEAVTGSADAAAIIDVLVRENLFVVPPDEHRQWFRYHHLFAQVLRGQLAATESSLVPILHTRASAWHRAYGSADEAIAHALAAGDADGATDLIARHFHAYDDSGRGATVRHWLRQLGDDRIAVSPLAAHCAAWTAALSGDLPVVQRCLPAIEAAGGAGPLPDGMRSFASSAAILRTICGFDGLGAMGAAGLRAVALETDPGSRWYSAAHGGLSTALYWAGEYGSAGVHAQEARLNPEATAPFRLLAAAVLTWLEVEAGRLTQAGELASEAWELGANPSLGLGGTARSSFAYLATGAVHAAQGHLGEARSELEHALEMRRKWPGISPWPKLESLLRLAPVLAGLGERTGTAAVLAEARQMIESLPDGADAQLARLTLLERRVGGRTRPVVSGEPLTERERDVLRMLQGTLSLRDIGRELFLSPNTIKTHTRTLYRKLDVSDRQDAVARGRELGLI
ncbi:MAG TPA: LuxR C-terminal-related transcriptional regulator [Streptosporangiaceae bacterium]|nr:LuxR C-terminal-related transcriptional regulator [Streptosporangiaceae bacterium]